MGQIHMGTNRKETPRQRAERKKAEVDPYYYMMSTSQWSDESMRKDVDMSKPTERFTSKHFEMDNTDMRIEEKTLTGLGQVLVAILIAWGIYWVLGTYLP